MPAVADKELPLPPPSHLELVSALLISDWERARRVLATSATDPVELIAWLRSHHLAGQFATIVDNSPMIDAFPAGLVKTANQHLANQARHNAKVLIATRFAVAMLKDCGIPSILLKGVHYALRFRGGLDQRFLWDVDLLVRAKDRERAIHCLVCHGYRAQTGAFWNNRITRGLAHAVSLHDGEIEVDLHWHLRNRPAYRIDYDALWESRQVFRIGDDSFDVPSDDYCLLTLLLGIAHDLEAGRFKLKQFFDLHCMLHVLEASRDWDRFFAARERERLARLSANVLALYLLLFDARSELPRLSTALDPYREEVRIHDIAEARRLTEGPRQNLNNRRWYASIYPGGPLNYALWWSTTAPLRFAIGRTL